MKRPGLITAISMLQMVFAICGVLMLQRFTFPQLPTWFPAWVYFISALHATSSIATFRLSLLGPCLFFFASLGAYFVGHVVLYKQTQPSWLSTLGFLLAVATYLTTVAYYRGDRKSVV